MDKALKKLASAKGLMHQGFLCTFFLKSAFLKSALYFRHFCMQ